MVIRSILCLIIPNVIFLIAFRKHKEFKYLRDIVRQIVNKILSKLLIKKLIPEILKIVEEQYEE